MNHVIASPFTDKEAQITDIIKHFNAQGSLFVKGRRNIIKTFPLDGMTANVKSFKVPNLLNTLVYRFLRKSKARRSFEFTQILINKGIGTPRPIAYYENYGVLGLNDSYYMCEHLLPDLTFRELVQEPNWPDHENILRQFTRFCFLLHENGVEFKDHSPGNTLIVNKGHGQYEFYLVDLNRMAFHNTMDFEMRMENLRRLTPKEEMVRVMSNEYARLYNKPEEEVFNMLWGKTSEFQRKFFRKKAMKKKLKFWKK